MKITYITHACLLIEVNKTKILTDPWLTGPSWGGNLWHYPSHKFNPKNLPIPDFIFFSHGHDDHYHEETISNFPKKWFDAKIIAPKYNVSWWESELEKKFKNIIYLDHNEKFKFKNKFNLQMFINQDGDHDSSIKIKDDKNCIFLQSDNLMSNDEARRIAKIDKIDLAFVIPFLTGVFPGFYKWDSDTLIKLANEKIQRSLEYCSSIVNNLNPKYTIPYSCDLGYLGDKFHINLIHRHNKQDLVKILKEKKIKTKSYILNSGDLINLSKNEVSLIKKNIKDKNEMDALIRFSNEYADDYKKYLIEEKSLDKPGLTSISNSFVKNLKRNLKKAENFKFKTCINIKEGKKNKFISIDFNKKIIEQTNSKIKSPNLSLEIEASKIRNLLLQKYPMNFMTFHNGGYTCERKVMNLSSNEKKYWKWIYDLDFFI